MTNTVSKNVYIYKLIIGNDNSYKEITYLGQTLSLKERLNNHISGNTKSAEILKSLKKRSSDIENKFHVKRIDSLFLIKITGEENQLNQSFIDSVRTNLESIVFDFTAKTGADFGAYNVEDIFNIEKKSDNDIKTSEIVNNLHKQKVDYKDDFKKPLKDILIKINESQNDEIDAEELSNNVLSKFKEENTTSSIDKLFIICNEINKVSDIKFEAKELQ